MTSGAGRDETSRSGRTDGDLRRALPGLALGLFGVSWAAVLVRLAAAPAPSVAFWRLVFSLLVVAPLLAAGKGWRELPGLTSREVAMLVLSGLALGLHLATWFLSLEYTSVASSTVLVTTHPIFVGVLSAAWLGERPDRAEWMGIVMAVAGAMLVGWGDLAGGSSPLRGDALALAAAVLAALYFTLGRRLRPKLGLWGYVAPVYTVAAVVAACLVGASGAPWIGFSSATWIYLGALALGPMLLGHTSFNWALRHVRAYVVSLVQLLEPVGATLLAILLLGGGEIPGRGTVLGGGVVLVGVWISLRARRRRTRTTDVDVRPAPGPRTQGEPSDG